MAEEPGEVEGVGKTAESADLIYRVDRHIYQQFFCLRKSNLCQKSHRGAAIVFAVDPADVISAEVEDLAQDGHICAGVGYVLQKVISHPKGKGRFFRSG